MSGIRKRNSRLVDEQSFMQLLKELKDATERMVEDVEKLDRLLTERHSRNNQPA